DKITNISTIAGCFERVRILVLSFIAHVVLKVVKDSIGRSEHVRNHVCYGRLALKRASKTNARMGQ
ncbi:MAG TPA: hypothetical protein VGE23_02670, partial [Candidatus Paceibacterota bacterium]